MNPDVVKIQVMVPSGREEGGLQVVLLQKPPPMNTSQCSSGAAPGSWDWAIRVGLVEICGEAGVKDVVGIYPGRCSGHLPNLLPALQPSQSTRYWGQPLLLLESSVFFTRYAGAPLNGRRWVGICYITDAGVVGRFKK